MPTTNSIFETAALHIEPSCRSLPPIICRCVAQASNAISSLLTLQPEVAVLAATGVPVAVESVPVGDAVLVKPGERIPCDGDVVEGSSAVDESMLTGVLGGAGLS